MRKPSILALSFSSECLASGCIWKNISTSSQALCTRSAGVNLSSCACSHSLNRRQRYWRFRQASLVVSLLVLACRNPWRFVVAGLRTGLKRRRLRRASTTCETNLRKQALDRFIAFDSSHPQSSPHPPGDDGMAQTRQTPRCEQRPGCGVRASLELRMRHYRVSKRSL